jgi:hypothetical protein
MKRFSTNPVKTQGGIDSYTTCKDQFAAERYMRFNSDAIVPHSATPDILQMKRSATSNN